MTLPDLQLLMIYVQAPKRLRAGLRRSMRKATRAVATRIDDPRVKATSSVNRLAKALLKWNKELSSESKRPLSSCSISRIDLIAHNQLRITYDSRTEDTHPPKDLV